MHRSPPLSSNLARSAGACALLVLLAAALPGAQAIEMLNEHFDWGEADQEQVTYEWSVEVVNSGDEAIDVEVVFQMLDDDDQVVHRDPVRVTLQADQSRVLRHDGSLQYERAADVVSYRFRFNPRRSGG